MGYDGLGGRTKFIQPVSFPAAHMAVVMLWGSHLCSSSSVSAVLGSPAPQPTKNGLRLSRNHQTSLYLTLKKSELSKGTKDLNLLRALSEVAHSEEHIS